MVDELVNPSLLIVDGHDLIRKGMRAVLSEVAPSYRIQEEASLAEALARIQVTPFDIVFIDASLGRRIVIRRTLRFVRESHLATRLVLLFEESDDELMLSCVSHGAAGCLVKRHVDERILQRVLETVRDGGIYMPETIVRRVTLHAVPTTPMRTAASLGLSPRQCEVLHYLCQGLTNKAIASLMHISEGTVRKSYVTSLLKFFGVSRRTELMTEVARRRVRVTLPEAGEG